MSIGKCEFCKHTGITCERPHTTCTSEPKARIQFLEDGRHAIALEPIELCAKRSQVLQTVEAVKQRSKRVAAVLLSLI